jgi:hypothetical protein
MNTIMQRTAFLTGLTLLGGAAAAAADDQPGSSTSTSTSSTLNSDFLNNPAPPRGAAITTLGRTLDRALPPGSESPVPSPTVPVASPAPPAVVVTTPVTPPAVTTAPVTQPALPASTIPTIPSTGTPGISIPITVPSMHF